MLKNNIKAKSVRDLLQSSHSHDKLIYRKCSSYIYNYLFEAGSPLALDNE